MTNIDIEYDLADVIIGRPYGFSVGRKRFCIYPLTLAKMYILQRHVSNLKVNDEILKANPYAESLRLVKENRDTCCSILAYHTSPNTKKDLFDTRSQKIRKNYFRKNLSDEELATLVIMILTSEKTEEYIKYLGIDKEREKISRIMEVKHKNDKNNVVFGGISIFGTFIGQLKEMGYSDDEILFEKGYTYLRLMLADKVTSIYLTDEERKEIPEDIGGSYVDASDPSNATKILTMLKNRGVNTGQELKS